MAFRLSAPDPSEQDIHEACAQALDKLLLLPAVWCAYPAGGVKLTPAQAARLIRMGLKRSWPDLLIFYQTCWGIELKDADGQLSKTRTVRTRRGTPRVLEGQEENFPKLIASGGFGAIAVCRSVEEMLGQVARWGIPLRSFTISGRPAASRIFR